MELVAVALGGLTGQLSMPIEHKQKLRNGPVHINVHVYTTSAIAECFMCTVLGT